MRLSWTLLFALALLAGCTTTPAPAAEEVAPEPAPSVGGAAAFQQLANASLPAIGFDVGAFNATRLIEGSFPTPNTCVIEDCPEQNAEHDLSADIPAQAPVDLTVSLASDTCLDARLRIDDGERSYITYGSVSSDGSLALRLVRDPAATVTLLVRNCSLLVTEGGSQVAYTAEVRAAVRPTVLPTYVPVALEMQVGDRLQGMGDELDALVVVPPGRAPIHLLGPFDFEVTDDLPAGRYVVAAKGNGEAMLHGTASTMRALSVRTLVTEPQAIASGQPWSQDITVPGVLLYAGLVVQSQPVAAGTSIVSFIGDHTVTFSQGGTELDRQGEDGCTASCGLTILGSFSQYYYFGYLPEGVQAGPLDVELTNAMSSNIQGYLYAGYVEP